MANIYWTHEARSYTYQRNDTASAFPTVTKRLLTASTTRERFVSSIFCHNNTNNDVVVAIGITNNGTLTIANCMFINTAKIPSWGTAILSDLKSPIYLNTSGGGGQYDLVYTILEKAGGNFGANPGSGIGGQFGVIFTVTYHEFADNNGF